MFLSIWKESHTDWFFVVQPTPVHTDKSFRNHIKSKWNRKMVNTMWFRLDLIIFREDFSCVYILNTTEGKLGGRLRRWGITPIVGTMLGYIILCIVLFFTTEAPLSISPPITTAGRIILLANFVPFSLLPRETSHRYVVAFICFIVILFRLYWHKLKTSNYITKMIRFSHNFSCFHMSAISDEQAFYQN